MPGDAKIKLIGRRLQLEWVAWRPEAEKYLQDKRQNRMTWWNWYCYDCKWRGHQDDTGRPEDGWACPKCKGNNIEDRGWHKEEDEDTRN